MSIVPHRPDIPDHYCIHLQAGIAIVVDSFGNSKVKLSPCAKYPFYIPTVDTDNVFLNRELVEFRERNKLTQLLEGDCANCTYREKNGLDGLNKSSFNNHFVKDVLFYNQTGPKFITFQIDMSCNLACVICGPHFSTRWRKEEDIHGINSVENNNLKEIISSMNLENLEVVHIYGGEPMLSPSTKIILEELQQYAHNITVWFDTNATVKPKKQVFELLNNFKEVHVKFSIDGIGKAFEYMRYPGVWDNAVDTMKEFVDISTHTYRFALRPAVGFLNFHIMNDLKWWYIKNFKSDKNKNPINFEYTPVQGIFAAKNMNDQMIADAQEMYKNDKKMLALTPVKSIHGNEKMIAAKNELLRLDIKRNLNYADCLPHLIKYFTG